MEAKKFVEQLSNIIIEVDLLKKRGVSDQFIAERRKSYQATPNGKNYITGHPIVDLIENFDCSNIEIGMINFDEKVEENLDYIFFGKFEIDDLAIDKATGCVVMLEAGLDHVLYECAKSDSDFLNAIYNVAVFLERTSVEEELYENVELNIQMAEEFGDIAGGKLYYDFYKMMLGV
ncbi:hypothetical protein ACR79N_21075 [Sphingobacterium siyangense]|uniref:hypothetical protein n=1 Tax=Sphingobacterium siyangense TaxID=459529 RepID=UPI003DA45366